MADTDRIEQALAVIDEAIEVHSTRQPKGGPQRIAKSVYALFSGGDDSLLATAIASCHPLFKGAIHIDTGIAIPDTGDFVRKTCAHMSWPLTVVNALEDCGQSYDDLVLEYGFPGPGHHYKMFQRLKERALQHFIGTTITMPDRTVLVSGRRVLESWRRAFTVKRHDRKRRRVYASPIHDWSACDVLEFIRRTPGLQRSPVEKKMHMSGDCLCGAFAHEGEKEEIAFWYPDVAKRLTTLECSVRARGHDWGWGKRPPKKVRDEVEVESEDEAMHCIGCIARYQRRWQLSEKREV